MRNTWRVLAAAMLASLPALAQAPSDSGLPKFPTPPPPVTAENSVIGPAYADPRESIANAAVPQGDIREFIMYSEDSKIYPGIVVVRPDSGGNDAQGSQRGLEYDEVSGRYSDWVETELLPAVTQKYGVTFTTDPEGRATMGGSSGAAAAFTMAWFHPERYRK